MRASSSGEYCLFYCNSYKQKNVDHSSSPCIVTTTTTQYDYINQHLLVLAETTCNERVERVEKAGKSGKNF